MSKINDGGPAFPTLGNVAHNSDWQSDDGMALRDYFAAKFLAGAASDSGPLGVSENASQNDIDIALRAYWAKVAHAAYIAADAMLSARKSPTE